MATVIGRAAVAVAAAMAATVALAACGGGSSSPRPASNVAPRVGATASGSATAARTPTTAPKPPPPPALVVTPAHAVGRAWHPVARVHGNVAVWQAKTAGVTLLSFDQRYVRLHLHAGEGEPEGNWRYSGSIAPSEVHQVIAAFNGGFKFSTGAVGWMEGGRVAQALAPGRGSIVTYGDGTSAIGAWHAGVPAHGKAVYSVLQNLSLLVDGGAPAANAGSCVTCWGATLGGGDTVARSALGVTGDGRLIWAGGAQLTPLALAQALGNARVARAVELDINPEWVAAYLFEHGGSGPQAVPVMPGQNGIPGMFLAPYTRDFFAVVSR